MGQSRNNKLHLKTQNELQGLTQHLEEHELKLVTILR